MPQLPLPPSFVCNKPYTLPSFTVIVVAALVVTIARGAAIVDGVEDDTTEGEDGEGVLEAEVGIGSSTLGRVVVVEFR